MSLVEYDDVIEKFTAKRSDDTLGEGILPGTSVSNSDLLDATGLQELWDAISVDCVIISKEILGLLTKRCCFSQLLHSPFHGWTVGHSPPDTLSSRVLHDDEDVEYLKSDRRDCEEIHGP